MLGVAQVRGGQAGTTACLRRAAPLANAVFCHISLKPLRTDCLSDSKPLRAASETTACLAREIGWAAVRKGQQMNKAKSALKLPTILVAGDDAIGLLTSEKSARCDS